jgi:hypothetical protein
MEVKRFGDGLLWQELLSITGSCNRGDPIPDTNLVEVAEWLTIHLDVTCREPSSSVVPPICGPRERVE